MRSQRMYVMVGVFVVMALCVMALSGALSSGGGNPITNFITYDCRVTAETLGRPWAYANWRCYIQQPNGSWVSYDTQTGMAQP